MSKKTFQTIGLFLVFLSFILTGYWVATNSGIYHLFISLLGGSLLRQGISALLTLLANLVGVAVIILVLRQFTKGLSPLKDGLQKDVDMLKAPGTLKEKLKSAAQQEREKNP